MEELENLNDFILRELKSETEYIRNSDWKYLESKNLKCACVELFDTSCIIYIDNDYDLSIKELDFNLFKIAPYISEDERDESFWTEVENDCLHDDCYTINEYSICADCGKYF